MKTRLATGALVGAILMACGCGQQADQSVVVSGVQSPIQVQKTNRVIVERISVIYDDIAYRSARGVYIIKDLQTGKEYFGISGIGISELGSHGKAQRDER
jgi:hypothetical protein